MTNLEKYKKAKEELEYIASKLTEYEEYLVWSNNPNKLTEAEYLAVLKGVRSDSFDYDINKFYKHIDKCTRSKKYHAWHIDIYELDKDSYLVYQ